MSADRDAGAVAEAYRQALEAADLDALVELCDPLLRWGPLEYPDAGCHNRKDALRFYRQGKAAGARATVTELTRNGDKMLVALRVTGLGGSDEAVEIWQVVTVRDGKVVDISGCEERSAGARAVGVE
jgi:hypothetical protein